MCLTFADPCKKLIEITAPIKANYLTKGIYSLDAAESLGKVVYTHTQNNGIYLHWLNGKWVVIQNISNL